MTVTFIDVPGNLSNTYEPIDFTTTEKVTSISVEFNYGTGSGSRETVFDGTDENDVNGDFSFMYGNSSRTGSGTVTWTVRRRYRWPAGPMRIRVKETEAQTGGQNWSGIYSVSLSSQPSQSIGSGGATFTIDGYTWYAKGALWTLSGGVNSLDNGSGLRLSAGAAVNIADRPQFRGVSGAFAGRVFWFPFAQLADYNASAPVYVACRLSGTAFNVVDASAYPCVGLGTAADSTASLTSGEHNACVINAKYSQGSTFTTVAGSSTQSTSTATGDNVRENYESGVMNFSTDKHYCFEYVWGGSFDNPFSSTQRFSGTTPFIESSLSNRGFFFSLQKPSNDAVGLDCWLTDLIVMQPKAV